MKKNDGPPPLSRRRVSSNLIKSGEFTSLSSWKPIHQSKTKDLTNTTHRNGFVLFERSESMNKGGTLGLSQDLQIDVSKAPAVRLEFDVWIGSHSLNSTGWWSSKHGGFGEMPMIVSLDYLDAKKRQHRWNCGFITIGSDTKGRDANYHVLTIPRNSWYHAAFDLKDKKHLKVPSDSTTMPPLATVTKLTVSGKGWDFCSAVGNLVLQIKPLKPGEQRAPVPTKIHKKQSMKKAPSPPPKPKQREVKRRQPVPPSHEPKGTTSEKATHPSLKYTTVYVDGSNVAYGSEAQAKGIKTTARNIRLVHTELTRRGFQKIVIIVDASLRHKVERPQELDKLEEEGIILQAPAKTAADQFLLEFAKKKRGYIVSNDRMDDWKEKDPWVKKNLDALLVKFMISDGLVSFVGF